MVVVLVALTAAACSSGPITAPVTLMPTAAIPGLTDSPGPQPLSPPSTAHLTPEEFGAKGNGIHDDSAALQAALNAASGHEPVWLSAGKTYRCAHTVEIPSNTMLEGAGPSTVLRFTWIPTRGPASGGGQYLSNANCLDGNANITLANFVVRGDASGLPSGPNQLNPDGLTPSIRFVFVDGFDVQHLEVRDSPGISIVYLGSQNGVLAYNAVRNSGRDGVTGMWYRRNLVNITVTHNDISKVGDDAIAVNGVPAGSGVVNASALPSNITITANTVLGWDHNPNGKSAGNGILIRAVNGAVVADNSITNSYANGILLDACTANLCPPGAADPATGQMWRSST